MIQNETRQGTRLDLSPYLYFRYTRDMLRVAANS